MRDAKFILLSNPRKNPIHGDFNLYCLAEETCLNCNVPVSTSASRCPDRCILSTSSFNSSIISFIKVQSFLLFNREIIASLRVGSATDMDQTMVYDG